MIVLLVGYYSVYVIFTNDILIFSYISIHKNHGNFFLIIFNIGYLFS